MKFSRSCTSLPLRAPIRDRWRRCSTLPARPRCSLLQAEAPRFRPLRRARSLSWRRAKDIAALIEGDAQLARTLRADGVHLPWSKDTAARYGEAREMLGTRYIVGIDVGRSRHDAMTLAEEGADYIGFGIPPHVEDRSAAAARRLELVSWWSEIFEVPCVAFDVDDVRGCDGARGRRRRLRCDARRCPV